MDAFYDVVHFIALLLFSTTSVIFNHTLQNEESNTLFTYGNPKVVMDKYETFASVEFTFKSIHILKQLLKHDN